MPDRINLHASLDPNEAKVFLNVLSQLLFIPNKLTAPRQAAVKKVHAAFSVDVNVYEKNKNRRRIEIRAKSGGKRGELEVPCAEAEATVARLRKESPAFDYVLQEN